MKKRLNLQIILFAIEVVLLFTQAPIYIDAIPLVIEVFLWVKENLKK